VIDVKVLKEFALFEGLDESKLIKIVEYCRERTLNDGALCFSQGNKATELHLCRSGRVDIVVRIHEPWGTEVVVHTVMPGEVFGWSALVGPYLFTASAKCIGKVEEIYLRGVDLLKFFEEDPITGYVVMRNLGALISSRLTESREKLTRAIAASTNKEW